MIKKVKEFIIQTLTMIIIASQLFGCASTPQEEVVNQIESESEIESEEQVILTELPWIELAYLDTYQDTLRKPIENILGIKVDKDNSMKTGMLYESNKGTVFPNNTLKGALQNKEFREAIENPEIISKISDAALKTFVDLKEDEEMTNFYMAINAYFNLLPSTKADHATPDRELSRAEFLALVARAEMSYRADFKASEEFIAAVGDSIYTPYAEKVVNYNYLDFEQNNINEQSFHEPMTRAEAVYMLIQYYLENDPLRIYTAPLDDVKDGGYIGFIKGYRKEDRVKAYNYYMTHEDNIVPEEVYSALVVAEKRGLIESKTRYKETITLEETISMLVNIYKTIPYERDLVSSGDGYTYNETTQLYEKTYTQKIYTKKPQSMDDVREDSKDGWVNGDVYYYEDGTTYLIHNNGNRYDLYDWLPGEGTRYYGVTEEDAAKIKEIRLALLESVGL